MIRTHKLFVAAFALTASISLGLPAHAQQGVGGEVAVTSATTAKEKLDFARQALIEMEDAAKRVDKLLDQAERGGDPDTIQCVRMKQASIRTLGQVSERAQASMSEAIAAGDDALADHEFRKITVATSKVRQFLAEAEACLGEAGSSDGVTDLQVEAEGTESSDDTEPITEDLGTIGVDPPGISPLE